MAIDPKKYTRAELAKMVEDAQETVTALEAEITDLKNCIDEKNDLIAEYANLKAEMQRKNIVLVEQLDQMNGEAINRANEITNLKADADVLRNKLADTEAALGLANAEVSRLTHDLTVAKNEGVQYASAFKYAVEHPFENLWAWVKRKLGATE